MVSTRLFFDIITIFPEMFRPVMNESIVKRAQEKRLIKITTMNLREYTRDKHASVDDYLYGGIPGMLMTCPPLARAIRKARQKRRARNPRVVYLSPKGKLFDHATADRLSRERSLILICGRYKGIDQRIVDAFVDEEVSAGDYVVSGGEIPAMLIIDAITRLLPGALGDRDSAESDSLYGDLLEPPNYTRPERFEKAAVPPILLSGHHAKIEEWRMQESLKETRNKRPDLFRKWKKDQKEA